MRGKKKHGKLLENSPGISLRSVDLPVEIIEEREQIEAQLTPGLLLAVVKDVGVHHAHGIVHDLGAVSRPVEKPENEERLDSAVRQGRGDRELWDICSGTAPPQMVEEQGDIQAECDPLSSTHEHQAEEAVDGVLRHHELPGNRRAGYSCDHQKHLPFTIHS